MGSKAIILPDVVKSGAPEIVILTGNRTKFFSPLIYGGSATMIKGDLSIVHAFALRIAFSISSRRSMMKGWTPSDIPCEIQYFVKREYLPLIDEASAILFEKNSKFIYKSNGLGNSFSPPKFYAPQIPMECRLTVEYIQKWLSQSLHLGKKTILIFDCSILPYGVLGNCAFIKIRDAVVASGGAVVFLDTANTWSTGPLKFDSFLSLHCYDISEGKKFIEAELKSAFSKEKKIWFSMDNLSENQDYCVYVEHGQKRKRIPQEVRDKIIKLKAQRNSWPTIAQIAEEYKLSIATVNRILKQGGATKLADPTKKRRGRKPTNKIETVNLATLGQAGISLNASLSSSLVAQANADRFTSLGTDKK